MIYEWKCNECQLTYDVYATVETRNKPSRCPSCNSKGHRVIAHDVQLVPLFPPGMSPIGYDGTYIKSRSHLREVCKREGLVSHYLEGTPGMEHRKPEPTPWTDKDRQELGQLYDATVGKV